MSGLIDCGGLVDADNNKIIIGPEQWMMNLYLYGVTTMVAINTKTDHFRSVFVFYRI